MLGYLLNAAQPMLAKWFLRRHRCVPATAE